VSSVGDTRPRSQISALARLRNRALALPPTIRGMLWMMASGLVFTFLNTTMRATALVIDPFEVQFLRYACGLAVMLPLMLRAGLASFAPNGLAGQVWRGAVHTSGLTLWFMALPHIPLANATAIGFTAPIFIMIGAALVLKERMVPARWLAAAIGFAGVLVVVGPGAANAASYYNLIMLGSAPLFAASFLITKALTRRDRPEVIVVWQSLTVSVFTLPVAVFHWTWPSATLWAVFVMCGILGSAGHYCMNRAFRAADISATQPVKFLDLIWNSIAGFLVFSDIPSLATVIGGGIIFVSTTWIARREARA
jgi:drug/metabolite transporter (DMT)-like permease